VTVSAVLLWFDAHAAPPIHAPGPRGDREAEVLLIRKETQLAALLDHVTAEAVMAWCGSQDTPPTDVQVEQQRQTFRAHYVRVVRASTHRKAGPR
jgi:hypothetical protein